MQQLAILSERKHRTVENKMSVPREVQELIDGSGNKFHAKVARWFIDDGWDINISPYYMDQSQQKARELDLLVEKSFPVLGDFGHYEGEIVVRLFIECKFVAANAVFWFVDKDMPAIEEMICKGGAFREYNTYTNKHHYLAGNKRVAKLFTSAKHGVTENEPFYKALNQALNGLVSLRVQSPKAYRSKRIENIQHVLDYPVVICSSFDKLYSADFDGKLPADSIAENFQLDVTYAYIDPFQNSRDESFLLDFVDFNQLHEFINSIGDDAQVAGFFSRRS